MTIALKDKLLDEYGAPVVGATIELWEEGGVSATASTVTNGSGVWEFPTCDEAKVWRVFEISAGAQKRELYGGGKYQVDSLQVKTLAKLPASTTLVTPTIADLSNAQHAHDSAAHGGTVDHGSLGSKGTNTHAQIDTALTNSATHIAAAAPHSGHLVAPPVNTSVTPAWNDHTNVTGPTTVTIPTAVGNAGQRIEVRNVGTGTVTIQGTGGQTINGAAAFYLYGQYEVATIESDGSNLMVV